MFKIRLNELQSEQSLAQLLLDFPFCCFFSDIGNFMDVIILKLVLRSI